MSQQLNSDLKIPSKTFLFGEYAILFGGDAYVLAHKPFFSESESSSKVHPKSPTGKLLAQNNKPYELSLFDPHDKKGGFGRSTAEFVLGLKTLSESFSLEEAFKKYLSFFKNQRVEPSGADFLVQFSAKSALVKKEPFSFSPLKWPFDKVSILICHTNNKVETHEHLNQDLSTLNFTSLIKVSADCRESLKNADFNTFLESLKEFSTELKSLGLLHSHSAYLMSVLNQREEVLFARGCGAYGADVVAILINENIKTQSLSSLLKELNLDLVCRV